MKSDFVLLLNYKKKYKNIDEKSNDFYDEINFN